MVLIEEKRRFLMLSADSQRLLPTLINEPWRENLWRRPPDTAERKGVCVFKQIKISVPRTPNLDAPALPDPFREADGGYYQLDIQATEPLLVQKLGEVFEWKELYDTGLIVIKRRNLPGLVEIVWHITPDGEMALGYAHENIDHSGHPYID